MAIYHVKKPKYSLWQWASYILPRVVFPPILLWDGAKWLTNLVIGGEVGKEIVPAQNLSASYYTNERSSKLDKLAQDEDLSIDEHSIHTYDGAALHSLEIVHEEEDEKDRNLQRYIINFNDENKCYEQTIDQMVADAKRLKCNVVGFNYRGVISSLGTIRSKDDLVIDGIAQVQRLIDQGIDPENIRLKGEGLGAGIATLVAKYFDDNKRQKLNLFNARSFSTYTNYMVGSIRVGKSSTGHTESVGRKILGWFAKPLIKFGLALVNWEIDAISAYKELDAGHKEYMVVRSSKARRHQNPNVVDDSIVAHYASLHAALKSERRDQKLRLDAANEQLNVATPLVVTNILKARSDIDDARNALKQRKMEVTDFFRDGHTTSLSDLNNRYDRRTGTDFFDNFFHRTEQLRQQQNAGDEKKLILEDDINKTIKPAYKV